MTRAFFCTVLATTGLFPSTGSCDQVARAGVAAESISVVSASAHGRHFMAVSSGISHPACRTEARRGSRRMRVGETALEAVHT